VSSSLVSTSHVTTVSPREHLVTLLGRVPDPRKRRGVRHPVAGLLAVAVSAVMAGARGFTAIGEWAADAGTETLGRLGLNAPAEESTFRRLFAAIDADALDRAIGVWAATRATLVGGRRVIAIDGKTVRGARCGGGTAPHLVAALTHGTGLVLGQVQVDAKSNEIPAARTLLDHLDLEGAVVTMDAMHTQHDTARAIVDGGGDYVFTVKGNQKHLYARLKALPWAQAPGVTITTTGHGRRSTRTIKTVTVPAWIEFTGATQIAQLRRTVTRAGKKSVELVYLITSAHDADPDTLATWVLGHWEIENRLHWVRDVTFDEDRSQVRTVNRPRVMASIRNAAIGLLRHAGHHNIAAATRHHARNPARPADLVLSP
jgi:predicted transposase YbfD/YdcC